jgi:hypothetical protein
MTVMFSYGAPRVRITLGAMPFMFTGSQEDQALYMIVTTGYGASMLATF